MLNAIVALVVRTELAVGGSTTAWSAAQAEFLGSVVTAGHHPHLAAALAEASTAPPASENDLLDRILPRMLAGLLEGSGHP
jgi:hypothetical protein